MIYFYKKSLSLDQYGNLLSRLKAIMQEGESRAQSAIEKEKVITYWKMGEILSKNILDNKDRADYGKQLFFRLSQDLNMGQRLLYQVVQFYETFPILHARAKLEWSHYRVLMGIKEEGKRKYYEKQAAKMHWSTRELENAVRDSSVIIEDAEVSEIKTPFELKPSFGKLYTYRLLKPDYIYSDEDEVSVDVGFSIVRQIEREGIAKVRGGEIISSSKQDNSYILNYESGLNNNLYNYKALVENVIDADTIWLKIDLGFKSWIRQKVRLRGIDAPELNKSLGQKGRNFVEKALFDVPFVIIKSYKSDKYDRYLVDIIYLRSTVENKILSKGTFLNRQLLELGLAKPYHV